MRGKGSASGREVVRLSQVKMAYRVLKNNRDVFKVYVASSYEVKKVKSFGYIVFINYQTHKFHNGTLQIIVSPI